MFFEVSSLCTSTVTFDNCTQCYLHILVTFEYFTCVCMWLFLLMLRPFHNAAMKPPINIYAPKSRLRVN